MQLMESIFFFKGIFFQRDNVLKLVTYIPNKDNKKVRNLCTFFGGGDGTAHSGFRLIFRISPGLSGITNFQWLK